MLRQESLVVDLDQSQVVDPEVSGQSFQLRNKLLGMGIAALACLAIQPASALADGPGPDSCQAHVKNGVFIPCTPGSSNPKKPEQQPASALQHPIRSWNQCGPWGDNMCAAGCGVVVSADVDSDLTGMRETPDEVLPIINPPDQTPAYDGGTSPLAFQRIAQKFHFIEEHSTLQGAEEVIDQGGVAIAEFNTELAIERSGRPSEISVVDHYVVLVMVRENDGKHEFALSDPHQAPNRHNEFYPNGERRYWSPEELEANGLKNVWTVRPTARTPQASTTRR
jgi:hypothetical protein